MTMIDVSGAVQSPPQESIDHMRRCLASSGDPNPSTPAPPLGCDQLRLALAAELGCDPGTLAVTSGARSALPPLVPFMPLVTFEAPTFQDLPFLARALGCRVTHSDWADVTSSDPQAVWLTHPSRNPDGACVPPQLASWIARRPFLTVINETYRWSSESPPLEISNHMVGVGSLAKIWGPAARLGWIRGAIVPELAAALMRTGSPPLAHQAAWARFLCQDGLAPLIGEARRAIEARRQFGGVLQGRLACSSPDGPSVLLELPPGMDEDSAARFLLEMGVKAGVGRHFGAVRDALRFTFSGISPAAALMAGEACNTMLSAGGTGR